MGCVSKQRMSVLVCAFVLLVAFLGRVCVCECVCVCV